MSTHAHRTNCMDIFVPTLVSYFVCMYISLVKIIFLAVLKIIIGDFKL